MCHSVPDSAGGEGEPETPSPPDQEEIEVREPVKPRGPRTVKRDKRKPVPDKP